MLKFNKNDYFKTLIKDNYKIEVKKSIKGYSYMFCCVGCKYNDLILDYFCNFPLFVKSEYGIKLKRTQGYGCCRDKKCINYFGNGINNT